MLSKTVTLLLPCNVNYFYIKTLPRSPKSCESVTFRISEYLFFFTFPLYTPYCHMVFQLKAKVLCFVYRCFNRESKTYLCTSDKAGYVANKKYDSYICWTYAELCAAFTVLMETKCAIGRPGLSTNCGDSYGHKLCSTIANFFFSVVMRGILCRTFKYM